MRTLLSLAFLLFATEAYAIKFNMANLGTSAFFRVSGGMQNTGASFYDQSSGAQTSFSDEVPYNYSAELGFHYSMSPKFGLKFGLELMQIQETTASGVNTGGTEILSVDTSGITVNPNMALELTTSITPSTKTFVFLDIGYANLKVINDYTMDGANPYGAIDYKESVEGTGLYTSVGGAFQVLTVDNVSTVFELGYRELMADELEYTADVTNVNGAQTEGSRALNDDGGNRFAKMSGPYFAISFRFHFPQF